MALTGQAKADYMRDYMRRRRESVKPGVRPGKTDGEMDALKAEIARLKAELATAIARIATLLTLHWGNQSLGDDLYLSRAATPAGTYTVTWHALNKPRGGGEWQPLPIEGDSFEASFSPWAKDGRRRLKTRPVGIFAALDEARAACQEHARAVT
jgi:hypothetical protein